MTRKLLQDSVKKAAYRFARLISGYRLKSFRSKLIFCFLAIIIIPITLSTVFSYTIFQNIVRDKLALGCSMAISQAKVNIDRVFNDMDSSAEILLRDQDIQQAFMAIKRDKITHLSIDQIKVINRGILTARSNTLNYYANNLITLIDNNSNVYTSASVFNPRSYYASILENLAVKKNGYYIFCRSTSSSIHFPGAVDSGNYIYMMRAYIKIESFEKTGDMIVAVPSSSLQSILEKMVIFKGIAAYIIDDKDQVVVSNLGKNVMLKQEILRAIHNQGKESLSMYSIKSLKCTVNMQPAGWNGWKVVQIIPDEVLFSEIGYSRNSLIAINLGFFAVFLLLSLLIANSMSRPIKMLSRATKKIATGDFQTKVVVTGGDEISQLAKDFNAMTVELDALMKQVNENEHEKRELELQALYAQVNPHFLFNTLNSIKHVADACKIPSISKLITGLSNLLHASILVKNEIITLAQEISNLKDYIFIQKFRYVNVFDEIYDIPEELMNCCVLKFILQPIIENSVIHGFFGSKTKGQLKIQAREAGTLIIITVSDNGVGMNHEKLNEILRTETQSRERFSGIGVSNVNDRLKLHYGNEYGIDMYSQEGIGTTTILKMPLVR